MAIKSFNFNQLADLRLEGVGLVHASFRLRLNINENNLKEGKKLELSASLQCSAAKAYGSGKIVPWCTVTNNIDHRKYILDVKGKSFVLNQNEILIGSSTFIIPYKKDIRPVIEVQAGYVLHTGYTGTAVPFPQKIIKKISLNNFK